MRVYVKWEIKAIFIIIVGVCLLLGCGKKAPPSPPRQVAPPIVKDLRKSIVGDQVRLSWKLPTVKSGSESALSGFSVFRSRTKITEPDCPGCPVLFEKISDIPIHEIGSAAGDGKKVTYVDTLKKGYRYRYKVTVNWVGGKRGEDSNAVAFDYE